VHKDRRIHTLTGFTFIEILIAMVLMLIAVFGIATVYTISTTFISAGYAGIDIQGNARILGERISRWMRPGGSVQITNNGDDIDITTLESVTPLQSITSRIYYSNGSFYHDNDISDGAPAALIATGIYKLSGQDVFSDNGDVVTINYGLASDYRYGNVRPIEVSQKIKLRTAE